VLETLVGLGVRHVVVSPGSRSQALALAADALERAGAIRMHVRIDERAAGFTALGIGRESGVPAALVCTSGTAVANYLPAVLEAHHAGVPLLLLTADRPPELRGVGANQTTDQVGIYGAATRLAVDAPVPEGHQDERAGFAGLAARAFDASMGRRGEGAAGPAHLNLPFREPLAGGLPEGFGAAVPAVEGTTAEPLAVTVLDRGPRTVVLAGADAGEAAVATARAGGWPLLAEVISGARTTPDAVAAYRGALREPSLGGRIERVVVFGHPTLNREETALLSRPDIRIVAVRRGGEALNLNGVTEQADSVRVGDAADERGGAAQSGAERRDDVLDAHGGGARDARDGAAPASAAGVREPDDAWRAAWDRWSADRGGASAQPSAREALVAAVWRASGPADRLLFGSSRLVRVADDVLPPRAVRVHANRGLAGIDGTIATGIGIALAIEGDEGVTRALLGDLTFLHDVGALLLPAGERAPRVQIVVGNDGGGTIFDGLEVAQTAGAAAMDRVQYTPQSVAIESIAAAYGWAYTRAETADALDAALAEPPAGPHIIEVPLPR